MSTERFVVYLISSTIVLVNINCAVIKESTELFQESTILVLIIEELIS